MSICPSPPVSKTNTRLFFFLAASSGVGTSLDRLNVAVPRQFVDDFKENAYIAARTLPPSLQSVEDKILALGSRTIPIEVAFCVPDYYYPEADEPSVNYGTTGVSFAAFLYNFTLLMDADKEAFDEFLRCQQSAIKALTELHVNTRLAFSAAQYQWAVTFAHSKVSTAKNSEKDLALDRLYYARICRSMCGMEEGRLICDYSVYSSAFAKTFGCQKPPPATC